ncbi:MAG: Sbal_3080 family lipoprotein [Methylococcaceae bacterium]
MRMLKVIFLVAVCVGCAAIQVRSLDKSYNVSHVCIEDNPKVVVGGYIEIISDVFQEHSITTETYSGKLPEHCEIKLTYTALRSWDFAAYLSHAELRLFKENKRIAYAEYHLRGKGGFALNKWASVKSKMTPVVNELLSQY